MQKTAPFTIYNAAAGSGKTFTLVKEYLCILLQSKNEGYYKNLLAITFTNKAVAEMKQRIISNLVSFSRKDSLENPPQMAVLIAAETDLTLSEIQIQSKKIVKHLLHHYSQFSVETIDHFNHRLIRTFARDLKLSNSFEVQLDIQSLIQEAVSQLLSKIGNNTPKTTKVLLDFALQKIDEDKSWDISRDIEKVSKLIFNENDGPHISKLKNKSLDDFLDFSRKVQLQKRELSKQLKKIGQETLLLIEEAGLEFSDFSRSSLPSFFQKLYEEDFNYDIKKSWILNLGETLLYTKKTQKEAPEIASVIDDLEPVFIAKCTESISLIKQLWLVDAIYKNSTPLSVINLVRLEIENIKEEKNIVPISDFNKLIHNEIKDQPVPFIYERLGDRYKHFFIDEFQDTSFLQWQNLKPLISNSLSQEYNDKQQGSLLLVGDAKQSIYRWRGGLPEQFIDLCTGDFDFNTKKEVLQLDTNYRSRKGIIKFNNEFFTFLAAIFGNSLHKDLYIHGNKQLDQKEEKGYVNIQFLEAENAEETDVIYSEKVFQTISNLKSKGYSLSDVCILTRSRKDGITLGYYLLENGIKIISSEILLLKHSPLVQCLIDVISLSLYPENEEAKISLLHFLHQQFASDIPKHTFFSTLLKTNSEDFSEKLKTYQLFFEINVLQTVSLYEACEYIIKQLGLDVIADAYLLDFMDMVFEFEKKPLANTSAFLEYWENQKDKLAIKTSENEDAVKIMTIHKSKGLEFPVVIFPYADLNIYKEIEAKTWMPIDSESYGFEETLVNFNAKVEDFGEMGALIYQNRRNTLELDNINLLYVTLTRASEELYVFCKNPKKTKTSDLVSYNQFFKSYLIEIGKWEEGKTNYEFGDSVFVETKTQNNLPSNENLSFISIPITQHNIKIASNQTLLQDTELNNAIQAGNLLHDTMEKIHTTKDVISIFATMELQTLHTSDEIKELKKNVQAIIKHPELSYLFQEGVIAYNERDIITNEGEVFRPDRLNFNKDNSVSIIDYKTGAPKKVHSQQITSYERVLLEIDFKVSEKILIYTNKGVININKV